jgi:hypothetical protein
MYTSVAYTPQTPGPNIIRPDYLVSVRELVQPQDLVKTFGIRHTESYPDISLGGGGREKNRILKKLFLRKIK